MDQKKKQLLVFGYGWAVILTFTAVRLWVKHGVGLGSAACLMIAAMLFFMTLLRRDWLVKIYNPWMKAMHGIGTVVNAVLMVGIFYLIFAPVGLFLRLIRKDLLHRKLDADAQSYWILKNVAPVDKSRYTQQF